MKRLMFIFLLSGICQAGFVQTTTAAPQTKEEKAEAKAKKEQEFKDDAKQAGLTDAQVTQVQAIYAETGNKIREVKKNAALSDDEKKAQAKEIRSNEKVKLIELLGEEKMKALNELGRKRKEASKAAAVGATPTAE